LPLSYLAIGMRQPTIFEFIVLIAISLALAIAGLYFLANFTRLFKVIRNELLRKNMAVWLVIFCISGALSPLSNAFFYILYTHGFWEILLLQLLSTTLNTLFGYNVVRLVIEHKKVKELSFIKRTVILLLTLIVVSIAINIPFTYIFYPKPIQFIGFSIISAIYMGGITGLIYAVISYLDIERKRKFDEKELELSKLRELKAKAELDALHSKVNPHFLYNALNSIADLSITDGKKARKMTVALADLFRYSINYSSNNYSTVKEELEMAEVYLVIEKIRFEDHLNCTIKADEDLKHYLVPRFILQPLIENAVKHGLKATGQMTEIELEIKKNEKGFLISISDNGPAFPGELNPGYGVKSVYDKLELLFPGNFELSFSNSPKKQVSIQIQKLMKNEPGI
jgi:two-component system, LytTR family, sensor kinase